ncbi:uncharacterized protein LOC135502319 [Lineus longissimus]|uniref:uncharacterized protein LOC135502319 n=1 Tax=Lineus longissimus TaxID=88925 RepID=UPI00315DD632
MLDLAIRQDRMMTFSNQNGSILEVAEFTSRAPIFEDENRFELLRDIVRIFGIYVTMVVLASGIFGNLLSIIVFIRLRKKDAVTATYLTPIAVYDLTNICIGTANWVVQALPAFSGGTIVIAEAVSDIHCKIRVYIATSSGLMSTWTLVAFCAERCIAIWLPLKVASLVTSTRRNVVLFLIILASLILSYSVIPVFQKFGAICIPMPKTISHTVFHALTDSGFYTSFPIMALCILNAILICGLSREEKSLQKDRGAKTKTNEGKIVRNLVLISCVCIATMTPFCVLGIIQTIRMKIGWGDASKEYIDFFTMLVKLAFLFSYTNFSANFFIYVSSLDFYRSECKKLFRCFWT